MEIDVNDIVKLNNNEEYIVESVIMLDNNQILYLRQKNKINFVLVKVKKENDQIALVDLNDDEYKRALEKLSI